MMRFTLPRDMYYGKGALEDLKKLQGKKAIVVSGGHSMRKGGFLDRVEAYLKEAGMEVKFFEGVEPDPSVETVMKGAQAMTEFQPDWIVAIGGGSPIDAAKAMWAFYEYPDTTFEDLIVPFNFPKLRTKAHFCAIPSTSGTATEVTAFSVITDYAKGIKYPLADFEITPDVAILDPDLVASLPVKQVAYTGMDALTHAIEAYVSTLHTPFTDALAIKAIEMVVDNLPASYKCNMDAREQMHYAQCLAVRHSPMPCSASFTRWHTRPVQHSQPDTSRMAVQMQFICHTLSSTMHMSRRQSVVMPILREESVLAEYPRTLRSTLCAI